MPTPKKEKPSPKSKYISVNFNAVPPRRKTDKKKKPYTPTLTVTLTLEDAEKLRVAQKKAIINLERNRMVTMTDSDYKGESAKDYKLRVPVYHENEDEKPSGKKINVKHNQYVLYKIRNKQGITRAMIKGKADLIMSHFTTPDALESMRKAYGEDFNKNWEASVKKFSHGKNSRFFCQS